MYVYHAYVSVYITYILHLYILYMTGKYDIYNVICCIVVIYMYACVYIQVIRVCLRETK